MDPDSNLLLENATIGGPVGAARTGKRWRVTLLREGVSVNGYHYSPRLIRESVPLFRDKWGNLDHPTEEERTQRPGGSVATRSCFYENVAAEQGRDGKWRLNADMIVIKPDLRTAMLEAWDAGRRDFAGLSINARATSFTPLQIDGREVRDVNGFEVVRTVDIVASPSAGGSLNEVLEATHGGSKMDEDETTGSAGAGTGAPSGLPDYFRAAMEEVATEAARRAGEEFRAQLVAAYEEAEGDEGDEDDEGDGVEESVRPSGDNRRDARDISEAVEGAMSAADERIAALEAELYLQRGRDLIEASLSAAEGLPAASKDRARGTLLRILEAGDLEPDDVDAMIKGERDYLAALAPANAVGTPAQLVTPQPAGAFRDSLMAIFEGAPVNGSQPFRSLREAYLAHPSQHGRGWLDVSPYEIMQNLQAPYDSERDGKRIQEAVSTATFGNMLADVMHMRLLKVFSELPYNDWRKFVTEVQSVSDFRTHNWSRMGQYDNIPSVGEGAPYGFLTTPSDEKASYSIAKYGGLEALTLEAVANDYLTQLRRIPDNMAYASVRTLYESVMDTVTTSGITTVTTYDGLALYHNTHGNKSTKALTVAGLNETQIAMRLLSPFGAPATEFLGPRNKIKNLIIQPNQELQARAMLNPSPQFGAQLTSIYNGASSVREMDAYGGLDPFAFANSGIDVTVYDKLSALGNHTWYATADPQLVDTLVVGFFNGRQAPEMFTQDLGSNVGSAFSADKITYKVRMFWGVGVLDHRGLYCNVLA